MPPAQEEMKFLSLGDTIKKGSLNVWRDRIRAEMITYGDRCVWEEATL